MIVVVVLIFLSGQLNAEEVVGKSIFPNIETPQTYPEAVKGTTLVWSTTIQEPGASWIKIHFSKFRLNQDDYVELVDMNGSLIERIKGKIYPGRLTRNSMLKAMLTKRPAFGDLPSQVTM